MLQLAVKYQFSAITDFSLNVIQKSIEGFDALDEFDEVELEDPDLKRMVQVLTMPCFLNHESLINSCFDRLNEMKEKQRLEVLFQVDNEDVKERFLKSLQD